MGDKSRAMLYMEDPHDGELIASTSFGRHENFWGALLPALDRSPLDHISVLVTAMSIGCEVYDASRIASMLRVQNIHFYGHDISPTFTRIAAQGIYPHPSPVEGNTLDRLEDWFQINNPEPGYMRVKPEYFRNVTILPPSDIRHLTGRFDVVVSNVMNPLPLDLESILAARARHMTLGNNHIFDSSPEFAPVVDILRSYRSWHGKPKSTLPGSALHLDVPEPFAL